MKLTADKLLEFGIADEIIPEPRGGAQKDHAAAAEMLREVLERHLKELSKMSGQQLKDQRYDKFRAMGRVEEKVFEAAVAEENV